MVAFVSILLSIPYTQFQESMIYTHLSSVFGLFSLLPFIVVLLEVLRINVKSHLPFSAVCRSIVTILYDTSFVVQDPSYCKLRYAGWVMSFTLIQIVIIGQPCGARVRTICGDAAWGRRHFLSCNHLYHL